MSGAASEPEESERGIPRTNAETVSPPRQLEAETLEESAVEHGDPNHERYYAIKREDYRAQLAGDDDRHPPIARINVLYATDDGARSFIRTYRAERVDGQDAHAFVDDEEPYQFVEREPDYGKWLPVTRARKYAALVDDLHGGGDV